MMDEIALTSNSDTRDTDRVLTNPGPSGSGMLDLYHEASTVSEPLRDIPPSAQTPSRSRKRVAKASADPASTSMVTIAVGTGRLRVGVSLWVRRCALASRKRGQRS